MYVQFVGRRGWWGENFLDQILGSVQYTVYIAILQFEHTLLITPDGVEALTARSSNSPPLSWGEHQIRTRS